MQCTGSVASPKEAQATLLLPLLEKIGKSNVALAQNVFVECAEQSTAMVIQPQLQCSTVI